MTRIYTLKNEVRSGQNVSIRRKLRSQNHLLVQLVFAATWESFSMAFATVRTDDLFVVVFFPWLTAQKPHTLAFVNVVRM